MPLSATGFSKRGAPEAVKATGADDADIVDGSSSPRENFCVEALRRRSARRSAILLFLTCTQRTGRRPRRYRRASRWPSCRGRHSRRHERRHTHRPEIGKRRWHVWSDPRRWPWQRISTVNGCLTEGGSSTTENGTPVEPRAPSQRAMIFLRCIGKSRRSGSE